MEKEKAYNKKHKGHVGMVMSNGQVVVVTPTQFQPRHVTLFEGGNIPNLYRICRY